MKPRRFGGTQSAVGVSLAVTFGRSVSTEVAKTDALWRNRQSAAGDATNFSLGGIQLQAVGQPLQFLVYFVREASWSLLFWE